MSKEIDAIINHIRKTESDMSVIQRIYNVLVRGLNKKIQDKSVTLIDETQKQKLSDKLIEKNKIDIPLIDSHIKIHFDFLNDKYRHESKYNKRSIKIILSIGIKCEYGCGQMASFIFGNTLKACCSKSVLQCPFTARNTSIRASLFAKYGSKWMDYKEEDIKRRVILKSSYDIKRKTKTRKNLTIAKYKKKYPTFAKIEELRYDPSRPHEKIFQVHCKNNKCKNSKENGGWFTPTNNQLQYRTNQVEHPEGNGGCYMYCSDKCKNDCILYGKHVTQLIRQDKISAGLISDPWYTSNEYRIWRKEVFRLDNETCQWCGKKATVTHHIFPRKTHPHMALDPDNGIACCKECHFKYGHSDKDCTTGHLSKMICVRRQTLESKYDSSS